MWSVVVWLVDVHVHVQSESCQEDRQQNHQIQFVGKLIMTRLVVFERILLLATSFEASQHV